jgi:hypothetical protein
MSTHIWDIKKFTDATKEVLITAYNVAVENGADPKHACIFSGHIIESYRQKGGSIARTEGHYWTGSDGINQDNWARIKCAREWEAKSKYGNRYLRSKYSKFYLETVRKIVWERMIEGIEFPNSLNDLVIAFETDSECAYPLHDSLLDNGFEIHANFVRCCWLLQMDEVDRKYLLTN